MKTPHFKNKQQNKGNWCSFDDGCQVHKLYQETKIFFLFRDAYPNRTQSEYTHSHLIKYIHIKAPENAYKKYKT